MVKLSGGEQNKFLSFDKAVSYPLAKHIAPIIHSLCITPNMITISNIFLRLFIAHNVLKEDKYNNILIMLILTHFLDVLDGTIARMYNQESELGAMLDHISDKLFWGFIIIFMIMKCKNHREYLITIATVLVVGIILCNSRGECSIQNFFDMNAIVLILVIYVFYSKN